MIPGEKNYYAFYLGDEEELVGTLGTSTLASAEEVSKVLGKPYRLEEISEERAKEVEDAILNRKSMVTSLKDILTYIEVMKEE